MLDGRQSRDFHERGNRHRMMVQKRLKEAREKGREKQEAMRDASETLREMERAAIQSYIANDMGDETKSFSGMPTRKRPLGGFESLPPPPPTRPRDFTAYQKQFIQFKLMQQQQEQEKEKRTKEGEDQSQSGPPTASTLEWLAGVSPEGYTYYYNTKTGVSSWEKPEGFSEEQQTNVPEENQTNESADLSQEQSKEDEKDKLKEEKREEEEEEEEESPAAEELLTSKCGPYGAWQVVNTAPQTDVQLAAWKSHNQPKSEQRSTWKSVNILAKTSNLISSGVPNEGEEDSEIKVKEEEEEEEISNKEVEETEVEAAIDEEEIEERVTFAEKSFPSDTCSVVKLEPGQGTAFKKRKLNSRKGNFRRTDKSL
ncbi:WW domain-binding protein 4-like isoform X2 [Oscarella lobularis]|uniref:WW domain-binding protein 4-like isoform X2 n=1 Tax=Oscarella lobularis TaxID=121494 RepID=UPI003314277C